MKKKQNILILLFIFIIMIYILFNSQEITYLIKKSAFLWFNKVFPALLPMFILNDVLLSYHIDYFIGNLSKKRGIKYYVFLMSLLSGSPSSAYIIKKLYDNNTIDSTNASKLLSFSSFASPLFLITMLSLLFNNTKIILKIILSHYLANFIISLFYKININNQILYQSPTDFGTIFSCAITKTMQTLIMILGTLTFYIIISNIISNFFNLPFFLNALIKGLLEITQGLNFLPNLLINQKLKIILATLFINFGGLSIHSQIKSIIADTKIDYKYFLKGRIWQTIISLGLIITSL